MYLFFLGVCLAIGLEPVIKFNNNIMQISISNRTWHLQTVPTWFKEHGIPVLNWPANSPDLNPIENLWGIVKRKMGGCDFP